MCAFTHRYQVSECTRAYHEPVRTMEKKSYEFVDHHPASVRMYCTWHGGLHWIELLASVCIIHCCHSGDPHAILPSSIFLSLSPPLSSLSHFRMQHPERQCNVGIWETGGSNLLVLGVNGEYILVGNMFACYAYLPMYKSRVCAAGSSLQGWRLRRRQCRVGVCDRY